MTSAIVFKMMIGVVPHMVFMYLSMLGNRTERAEWLDRFSASFLNKPECMVQRQFAKDGHLLRITVTPANHWEFMLSTTRAPK